MKLMRRTTIWILPALFLLTVAGLVGIAACGASEVELPLETIERGDYGDYAVREPRMVLVTSRDDIVLLKGLVSEQALDELAALDFQQYFAIALFRGRQAYSGYDTIIERVASQGDKVVVYAQFWEPSPYVAVRAVETSPYHLIKMRREGEVNEETQLVLRSHPITPPPPFSH